MANIARLSLPFLFGTKDKEQNVRASQNTHTFCLSHSQSEIQNFIYTIYSQHTAQTLFI